MAIVNQDLYLEITPGTIPPTLNVTEYDENMQVTVHLLQRGQAFEVPSGTAAKVEGTLAGHPFRVDATSDGSTVTFELDKSMTAFSGRAWTKIKLTKDSKPVSTCGFWLDCDRAGAEADDVIGAPGFAEQIANAVAGYLAGNGDMYAWRGSMQALGLTAIADCTANGAYQIPAGYSSSITDLPEDYQPPTSGFVVSLPMASGTWQVLGSMRGFWVRSKGSGAYSSWERLSGIRAIWTSYPNTPTLASARINGIYQLPSASIGTITDLPEDYGTGAGLLEVRSNYAAGAAVTWQRLTKASGYTWVRTINTAGTASDWARSDHKASSDSPYSGLRLSVLGDSISAFTGTIPAGNSPYYNGSNAGVASADQMWWSVLCAETGMVPLVINGWSGSCVASGVRDATVYKPASDVSRCEGLDDGTHDPDVILIAMGVNDWSYGGSLGNWDGKTAAGDVSTFKTAYATMVRRVQAKYPGALIAAVTPWFCQRGTLSGEVYVNGNGDTLEDFCAAVRDVANLLHIRVLDGNRVGFHRNNYYPTYCEDSSTIPTHPNAAGHDMMGRAIAAQLRSIAPLEVSV